VNNQYKLNDSTKNLSMYKGSKYENMGQNVDVHAPYSVDL
jgi:hypothetical protein